MFRELNGERVVVNERHRSKQREAERDGDEGKIGGGRKGRLSFPSFVTLGCMLKTYEILTSLRRSDSLPCSDVFGLLIFPGHLLCRA